MFHRKSVGWLFFKLIVKEEIHHSITNESETFIELEMRTNCI